MPPRKALSPERRISARVKRLSLSLTQLRHAIDADGGRFKRDVQLAGGDHVRLVITCRNRELPEAWAMSLLWRGVCIDCIDFHRTDYRDAKGVRRVGWHRDLKEGGRTVSKVCLPSFNPETLDGFITQGLEMFNIKLAGGDNGDAHSQMRFA